MGGSVGNQGTGSQGSGAAPNKGLGLAGGQASPMQGGTQPSTGIPFNPTMPGGLGGGFAQQQPPIQQPQMPPQQQPMNPFFSGIGSFMQRPQPPMQQPGQVGIEPPEVLYGGQMDPRMEQMMKFMQQYSRRMR